MSESTTSKETRPMRPWFAQPPLSAMRQEMNELLENFFGESFSLRGDTPKLDVAETEDAVEVTTDLPGFKPEDISIDIGENYLTISGKHSDESKQEGQRKYHRLERRMSNFSRSVWLPCPVDEDQVDAKLANGVLTIRMPKREQAKRKKIQVKGGDAPPAQI